MGRDGEATLPCPFLPSFPVPRLAPSLPISPYSFFSPTTSFQFRIELKIMLNSPWFCQR